MGRAVSVERYARWFRDHPTWLTSEDQPIAEFLARYEAPITQTVRQRARALPKIASDDLTQEALLAIVEVVREVEAEGGDPCGPLALLRVRAAIERARYAFARARDTERPEYREPGQGSREAA